jgi:hypothetical protein
MRHRSKLACYFHPISLFVFTAVLLVVMPHSVQARTFTSIYSFEGGPKGKSPSSLVAKGNFIYGITFNGGDPACVASQGCGTVFRLARPAAGQTAWKHTLIHTFTGGAGGYAPSRLVLGKDGHLYGTTSLGGRCAASALGCGVFFQLALQGGTWRYSPAISQSYRDAAPFSDSSVSSGTRRNGGRNASRCEAPNGARDAGRGTNRGRRRGKRPAGRAQRMRPRDETGGANGRDPGHAVRRGDDHYRGRDAPHGGRDAPHGAFRGGHRALGGGRYVLRGAFRGGHHAPGGGSRHRRAARAGCCPAQPPRSAQLSRRTVRATLPRLPDNKPLFSTTWVNPHNTNVHQHKKSGRGAVPANSKMIFIFRHLLNSCSSFESGAIGS